MREMDGGDAPGQGTVTSATWIRRPENAHLAVVGKWGPSSLEIFSFDPNTISLSASPKVKYEFEEGVNPVIIAVHPGGDELICSTSTGDCKLFELYGREDKIYLTAKEQLLLQGIGPQKCLAFSIDGTKFATGGIDGCLRIFEWPSMRIILDEPRAHKSFQDMDFSLDSVFLASTSTDGTVRIWNTSDGAPVTTLTRNSDEIIELCRFSKDGTKPLLFCSVQRGNKPLIDVWDISEWKRIGHKRLLNKPASILSVSLDGKYLALASKDGDICVVEVKKMEVRHWSKRLHSPLHHWSSVLVKGKAWYTHGPNISGRSRLCRVVLATSKEWGVMVTKLYVPADWKEWQIYLLLLGLFLASLVAFYIFFKNSDLFWNFPLAKDQAARPNIENNLEESHSEQNMWVPLDL